MSPLEEPQAAKTADRLRDGLLVTLRELNRRAHRAMDVRALLRENRRVVIAAGAGLAAVLVVIIATSVGNLALAGLACRRATPRGLPSRLGEPGTDRPSARESAPARPAPGRAAHDHGGGDRNPAPPSDGAARPSRRELNSPRSARRTAPAPQAAGARVDATARSRQPCAAAARLTDSEDGFPAAGPGARAGSGSPAGASGTGSRRAPSPSAR